MAQRANGEGTIYRRKDGRYEAAAYVVMTDGTRRRVRVYGSTRREAADKLEKIIAQDRAGVPQPQSSLTVGEYLDQWLETVAKLRVRPLTYHSYEMYVRQHIKPGLGRIVLRQLTAGDIRRFLARLRKRPSRSPGNTARPLTPRTIAHVHAILRNALEHAVRDDVLARNVARQVQMATPQETEPEPLTLDEARRLLDAAARTRLHAAVALSLALGLRRGEVLGLRWIDLDLDRQVLQIRQTLQYHDGALHTAAPKTRRSRRTIPLPSAIIELLQAHRDRQAGERTAVGSDWQQHGLVFTTRAGLPVHPNDFSKAFGRLCEQAGIRRIRLHDLRHSCASFLLAQGVPPRVVMEILGHATIDVTMNIYGHVMLDAQRAALQHVNDLF